MRMHIIVRMHMAIAPVTRTRVTAKQFGWRSWSAEVISF